MAMIAEVKNNFRDAIIADDVHTVQAIITSYLGQLNLNHVEKDQQFSFLMLAALNRSLCTTKLLVEQGRSDPNIQNNDGQSALMLAAYKGHVNVVQYLLTHNADPLLRDNSGASALDLATTDEVRVALGGSVVEKKITPPADDSSNLSQSDSERKSQTRSLLLSVFGDVQERVSENSQTLSPRTSQHEALTSPRRTVVEENKRLSDMVLDELKQARDEAKSLKKSLREQKSVEEELRKQINTLETKLRHAERTSNNRARSEASVAHLLVNQHRQHDVELKQIAQLQHLVSVISEEMEKAVTCGINPEFDSDEETDKESHRSSVASFEPAGFCTTM